MTARAAVLAQAFPVAAGELGMASAAWLFVREVAAVGGTEAVIELRDGLGRAYPVLDAVAARYLAGDRSPRTDPGEVLALLRGIRRLLVVGLESDFLDALVPRLAPMDVGLLARADLGGDGERVVANYGGRVQLTDLGHFQSFAGRSSAVLAFVYGRHGTDDTYAGPSWLRVQGPDVRTQFRAVIAWDVLQAPFHVYPRWLVPCPLSSFSHLA